MPRVIVYNKTLLELREYLGNQSDHATKVFQASQNAFKAWWKDNNPNIADYPKFPYRGPDSYRNQCMDEYGVDLSYRFLGAAPT